MVAESVKLVFLLKSLPVKTDSPEDHFYALYAFACGIELRDALHMCCLFYEPLSPVKSSTNAAAKDQEAASALLTATTSCERFLLPL